MCDIARSQLIGINCGHVFCPQCWLGYLNEVIGEQGRAVSTCPAYGCNIYVDELTVTRILEDSPQLLARYNVLAAKNYVTENKQLRWCPRPGCDNALRLTSGSTAGDLCIPVQDSSPTCGHEFCFRCQNAVHPPVTCTMIKAWLKNCQDDSETANWINSNTKECQKCLTTIEKSGGCNHMICTQASCRYDFCWVCLGPWAPHGSSWYVHSGSQLRVRSASINCLQCSRTVVLPGAIVIAHTHVFILCGSLRTATRVSRWSCAGR